VVTLTGDVQTEADKQRAEDVTRSFANSLVISNQIGVRPPGFESEAKKVDSSLDTAIEKNFEAILIGKQLNQEMKYVAKNGVLTLSGEVESINKRYELEQLAASVPNVKQVVNELQIKGIKATARK
jgi:osmotically-inducible protein OsmY